LSQSRDKRPILVFRFLEELKRSWEPEEASWRVSLWRGSIEELCKTTFWPVDGTRQGRRKELWERYLCG